MDREPEELRFLGMFGMYGEAYKIIFTWKKIFSKLTLALILPLSFIFLAQLEVSHFLFRNIRYEEYSLHHYRPNSPMYNRIASRITSDWITYWLFKAAYFVFLLVLSLLSTSGIVYAVASIYTGKEVTFKKVLSVVPKVWKRLMVTFIWNFVAIFLYNLLAFGLLIAIIALFDESSAFTPVFITLAIFYVAGFVYVNLVWHLASVISVLEDTYGFKAMMKSKELIKGKRWVASAVFLKLNVSFFAIQIAFQILVVHGGFRFSLLARLGFGVLLVVLLCLLIHLGLVMQSVIYFVCKAYHHESIDKSCLADHLEGYAGEYVPLKGKDVQLESFYV